MSNVRDKLCLGGLIAVLLWPVGAYGQARSRYKWHTGNLSGISTVGGDFRRYSSGLAGLRRPSAAGAAGGVLSSSIARLSDYSLRRGTAGATALTTPLPRSATPAGRTYGGAGIKFRAPPGGLGPAGGLPKKDTAVAVGIGSRVASMGRTVTTMTAKGVEPIGSFVPTEPGYYQKRMEKGEQAFKAERFSEATAAFEVAVTIGRYAPESHLSLVHAYSALGRYHSAAYHLHKALKYLPELPLAPLRVRLFYSRAETFVSHVEKLREAAEEPGAEANLFLLLAYFRHFDGDEAGADKALRRGLVIAGRKKDREMADAIEAFRRGMAAAGKAEGNLGPTTKPAGSARPAAGSPVPARMEPTTRPAVRHTDDKGGTVGPSRKRGAE